MAAKQRVDDLKKVDLELEESGKSPQSISQSTIIQAVDNPEDQADDDDSSTQLGVSNAMKLVAVVLVVVLGGGLLVFSVIAKTSFVAIASRLELNLSESGKQFDDHESIRISSVAFIQLILILCAPQVFTVIRTFLFGVAGKSSANFPWPKRSSFLLGVLVSVVESAGLSGFTLIVSSRLDPANTLWLHCGVFTGASISGMWYGVYWPIRHKPNPRSSDYSELSPTSRQMSVDRMRKCLGRAYPFYRCSYKGMVHVIGPALHIAGLIGSAIFICMQMSNVEAGIAALVCVLSLSIVWSVSVQKCIFESHGTTVAAESRSNGPVLPASRKGGFVYALVRLVCIPVCCAAMSYISWCIDETDFVIDVTLGFTTWSAEETGSFFACILGGFLTYFLSLMSLWSTYQKLAFTLPLMLSTPVSVAWFWLSRIEAFQGALWPFTSSFVDDSNFHLQDMACLTVILFSVWLSSILILGYNVWISPHVPVSREQTLYLSPYFDGVFIDSFLLLNRINAYISHLKSNEFPRVAALNEPRTIFICSTMYHEREHEMRQMLRSIQRVAFQQKTLIDPSLSGSGSQNPANQPDVPMRKYQYESHIFFDGAVQGNQLNEYALQLFYLVEKVFDNEKLRGLRKLSTPYGYEFYIPGSKAFPIPFHVHLKDNTKIKNKKRWSQIMYMKYILDFRRPEDSHNTFILATDADIDFTVESVEALLDFLARDDTVGAVCARTYPKGSGPIAWYQMYEYGLGHWFQKSAEHVLGCVLCCPGCFSAYRVSAISQVIRQYQSNVTGAFDFLTKDMGEDRWLCTLLIHSQYRLEYAALSNNTTFCPDNFNEFFNQRRRWVPSTMANLFDLVASPATTTRNDSISYFFVLYQVIIIFATAISPATVILIMASGMQSAYGWNTNAVIITLSVVSVLYGLVCLFTPEKVQLLVAKVLTLLFALLIAIAYVGIIAATIESIPGISDYTKLHWLTPTLGRNFTNASQSAADDRKNAYLASLPNTENQHMLPISLDAVFVLGFLFSQFVAALLHPGELHILIHMVFYILGLPSGYLLLLIYSACNLNTRSWGTRVDAASEAKAAINWKELLWQAFLRVKDCCNFCLRRSEKEKKEDDVGEEESTKSSDEETTDVNIPDSKMEQSMKKWLNDLKCSRYVECFQDNGYTRLEFIEGMTMEDLKAIGVKKKGFQQRLAKAISQRPTTISKSGVSKDVKEFLKHLHLDQEYTELFKEYGYELASDVDNLLTLTKADLEHMGITKRAHLKHLLSGIQHLKYPSSRDLQLRRIKAEIDSRDFIDLGSRDEDEVRFWQHLVGRKPSPPSRKEAGGKRQLQPSPLASRRDLRIPEADDAAHCGRLRQFNENDIGLLKPEAAHLNPNTDYLKKQLAELRNNTVVAILLINIIWLSLILSVQLPFLEQWGINPDAVPVAFLGIYFVVLAVQFVALLVHRMETLLHVLARAYRKPTRAFRGAGDFQVEA